MKDESVRMGMSRPAFGIDAGPCSTELAAERQQLEWCVMVVGDKFLRAQSFSGGPDFFLSTDAPKRHEITLSGSQLMIGVGSALGSIFLFVWALTRLWLFGR